MTDLPLLGVAALLAVTGLSFTVSAAVGLGGSLLLVPTLVLALGAKEGVALAALLLAANNVVKVGAYRSTLPFRAAAVVVVCTLAGATVGAGLLTRVPAQAVTAAVLVSLGATLLLEGRGAVGVQRASAPGLAVAAGATSGFSGTSGPLKGIAVRGLRLDRLHTVGAASLASLAGDLGKTAVFTEAGLLGREAAVVALLASPLMLAGTALGRRLTAWLGERRWAALFWTTMAGYSVRLLVT